MLHHEFFSWVNFLGCVRVYFLAYGKVLVLLSPNPRFSGMNASSPAVLECRDHKLLFIAALRLLIAGALLLGSMGSWALGLQYLQHMGSVVTVPGP